VDDEPVVVFASGHQADRELLAGVLEEEGFRVRVTGGATDVRTALDAERPDVALVDTRLTDGDAIDLVDQLSDAGIPAAVVGSHAERERLPGASAFFVRPVVASSLVHTVRSLIRRHRLATAGPILRFDPMVVDVAHRTVTVGTTSIHLAPKEFDVLAQLAGSAGRTVTVHELLHDVWDAGPGRGDARTVAVHVRRIRQKLATAGLPDCIRTVRGAGYMFVGP
jgi:two-component system KDP operon response regulator KdpE